MPYSTSRITGIYRNEACDDEHDGTTDSGRNLSIGHQLHAVRSAETLYVAGTTAVCHTESGSQHSFYRIEVEQLTDDEGSDHRTDDSRHDDDDIRWVCEDLRVVCEVRTDTNGNHQWEGHILYEELLHAPCAGLHVSGRIFVIFRIAIRMTMKAKV